MKLFWTEPAINDLERIKNYIAEDSENYAIMVIEEIFITVEKLLEFPEMGRIVPEAKDKKIRELFIYSYRIIYKIDRGQIEILTIIHGARNFIWNNKTD